MKQRVFDGTGVSVSEIGLGAWQLGGTEWGDVPEEEAFKTLRAAIENGINFFDTADVYGLGRSEELIGKFLKECSEKVFVATKLGRFPEPGWPQNFSLEAFRAHTEASLRRLGVDALDLIQLHCIPPEVLQQGEVFEWLRLLKQEGKIRHFGVSVESMEEALVSLNQPGLTSLQIIFNIYRQKPIEALFHRAQEKNIALIVRLPLASGLLSGKYTKETKFPESDHRNFNRNGEHFNVGETFAGLPFERGVELTEILKPLVPQGMTMAQMALRWILDFEQVSVVIAGARNPAQVEGNARASDLPPLGPELHEKLKSFYEEEVAMNIRGPY
ncbi:MAG TPA: aldo/keto reductase [Pyrinomonadaceae bacterium]|jgi:aryl-alcohol dehydrogenase-like predicted oxidoreductase